MDLSIDFDTSEPEMFIVEVEMSHENDRRSKDSFAIIESVYEELPTSNEHEEEYEKYIEHYPGFASEMSSMNSALPYSEISNNSGYGSFKNDLSVPVSKCTPPVVEVVETDFVDGFNDCIIESDWSDSYTINDCALVYETDNSEISCDEKSTIDNRRKRMHYKKSKCSEAFVQYNQCDIQELHTPKGVLYYVVDGYFFCKTNVRVEATYYKCHVKNCQVRAILYMDEHRFVVNSATHSHLPDFKKRMVEKVKADIIHRCLTEDKHPRAIYSEEISKFKYLVEEVPYSSFCRTIQRKRKMHRKLPPKKFFRYSSLENQEESTDGCDDSRESDNADILQDNSDVEYERIRLDQLDTKSVMEDQTVFDNSASHMLVVDIRNDSIDSLVEEVFVTDESEKEVYNENEDINSKKKDRFVKKNNISASEKRVMEIGDKCVLCSYRRAVYSCVPCRHFCLCKVCKNYYDKSTCPICGKLYNRIWRTQMLFTSRGVLYHQNDGYFYTKAIIRGTKLYLQCHAAGCAVRARTLTSLEERIIESPLAKHNHPPQEDKLSDNKTGFPNKKSANFEHERKSVFRNK